MKKIEPAVAAEHLRDGLDNIKECLKTIERVGKSYPELSGPISTASGHLTAARTMLIDVHTTFSGN